MIASEAIFKGRVQGVGFRYTACDIARELGVGGLVKNLPDGSVHLVAEGDESAIKELIRRLEMNFHVRSKQVVYSPVKHGFVDFSIK